jgi:hypothetical protein
MECQPIETAPLPVSRAWTIDQRQRVLIAMMLDGTMTGRDREEFHELTAERARLMMPRRLHPPQHRPRLRQSQPDPLPAVPGGEA